MKHFIVQLNLRSGEYEKNSITLVKARNPVSAARKALKAELHHSIGDGAEKLADGSYTDAWGEWHYEVYQIIPVQKEDVLILQKYLTTH